jgi:recombinational DNA repair protein (RecF pathway)
MSGGAVLEGVVMQVVPQKERDLIAKLLLRDGTAAGVYVYGGMGGGTQNKPRVFEPGNMMRVQIRPSRAGVGGDLAVAAENLLLWRSAQIRHDARAFALLCLYLEMSLKTAVTHHPGGNATEHAGHFGVVSNALFHLDQALAEKSFAWSTHLTLFLTKFLHHLGILPDEASCVFCGEALGEDPSTPLVADQGGFACAACAAAASLPASLRPVRPFLAQAVRTRFQDWRAMPEVPPEVNVQLMQFWGHHLNVRLPDLASYRLLF